MSSRAEMVADSISEEGVRICTLKIMLPKVLLAELGTHRVLSKNFSSSRAMPVQKSLEVESFEPLYWGKNQKGMSASPDNLLTGEQLENAKNMWDDIIAACKRASSALDSYGLHKQWANRCNDWHTTAVGIITSTEWEGFFAQRLDSAAQPEMQELALSIQDAMAKSTPNKLLEDQWHMPFIKTSVDSNGIMKYFNDAGDELCLDDALAISTSMCAQISYRNGVSTLEKAKHIFQILFATKPIHASPLEHQATPLAHSKSLDKLTVKDLRERSVIVKDTLTNYKYVGLTHIGYDGSLWSGNFRGWQQHRQILRDNLYA